jgi:hypothetical protein
MVTNGFQPPSPPPDAAGTFAHPGSPPTGTAAATPRTDPPSPPSSGITTICDHHPRPELPPSTEVAAAVRGRRCRPGLPPSSEVTAIVRGRHHLGSPPPSGTTALHCQGPTPTRCSIRFVASSRSIFLNLITIGQRSIFSPYLCVQLDCLPALVQDSGWCSPTNPMCSCRPLRSSGSCSPSICVAVH